jgi:hypothetical protein
MSFIWQPFKAEILSAGINILNELNLSTAQPALDFFLPCNRLPDVIELLEVN